MTDTDDTTVNFNELTWHETPTDQQKPDTRQDTATFTVNGKTWRATRTVYLPEAAWTLSARPEDDPDVEDDYSNRTLARLFSYSWRDEVFEWARNVLAARYTWFGFSIHKRFRLLGSRVRVFWNGIRLEPFGGTTRRPRSAFNPDECPVRVVTDVLTGNRVLIEQPAVRNASMHGESHVLTVQPVRVDRADLLGHGRYLIVIDDNTPPR